MLNSRHRNIIVYFKHKKSACILILLKEYLKPAMCMTSLVRLHTSVEQSLFGSLTETMLPKSRRIMIRRFLMFTSW